jgi:hypothetical protein
MIHNERNTYGQWLSQPELILDSLRKRFRRKRCDLRRAKFTSLGLNPTNELLRVDSA